MLHTNFSKLTGLDVKYNDKSTHYTHPGLPSGDSQDCGTYPWLQPSCPKIHKDLAPLSYLTCSN